MCYGGIIATKLSLNIEARLKSVVHCTACSPEESFIHIASGDLQYIYEPEGPGQCSVPSEVRALLGFINTVDPIG